MEKFFKIKSQGSTVSREVIGGVTTFLAMVYILVVNPQILGSRLKGIPTVSTFLS